MPLISRVSTGYQGYANQRKLIVPQALPSSGSATVILDLDASLYSGSGNWLDNSGNGNNGVASGTPTYTASEGSYFTLDGGSTSGPGTNDAFGVTDSSTLDTMSSISFEMWIYINALQSTSPILLFDKRSASTNGYVGFVNSNGYTFRVGTASPTQLTYSVSPTTGVWQHIIVTVGSGGSKVYRNNSEVVSSPTYVGNFSNINTATTLRVGDISIAATGVYSFNGRIGLMRIYSGELSASDVTTRWDATRNRFGL